MVVPGVLRAQNVGEDNGIPILSLRVSGDNSVY